jgi:hypothetical protein
MQIFIAKIKGKTSVSVLRLLVNLYRFVGWGGVQRVHWLGWRIVQVFTLTLILVKTISTPTLTF